ncbi:MAG: hypothetical protein H6617_05565 [Bdellovibrionaceae bacterium]|nr:hypothetical protein [Bdellovibrionales bacterium]MCB9254132.1 hypothetical protein [Pseudobdellovibrionaceae bacterium]
MKKQWLVVLGAWLSLSLAGAEHPDLPVVAPECGWSVAHFNIFNPKAVVAAWQHSSFVKRVLAAQHLETLETELATTPPQFQYDMTVAREWLESLRSIEIDFPIIVYSGTKPMRQGYEKRNPMATVDMTQLIAQIALRGVKAFKRQLYRSRESIRFFENSGFDAVTYEVTHFDNSRSDIVCYVVSEKAWFAPFGYDEAKSRHAINYVLISNGNDSPETFAHLEHGHLQLAPAAVNTPDTIAMRSAVQSFAEDFVGRGDIFEVAEDSQDKPIEGVN